MSSDSWNLVLDDYLWFGISAAQLVGLYSMVMHGTENLCCLTHMCGHLALRLAYAPGGELSSVLEDV